MQNITLTVIKEHVFREVSRTTEYMGSKSQNDSDYDIVSTTDEDQDMLERFWNESKNLISDSFKKVLVSVQETQKTTPSSSAEGAQTEQPKTETTYSLELGLSDSFDTNLQDSMASSLFSFFVANIISKWYTFTSKDESTDYAGEAAGHIEDIKRKAYFKKKPTRPTYK